MNIYEIFRNYISRNNEPLKFFLYMWMEILKAKNWFGLFCLYLIKKTDFQIIKVIAMAIMMMMLRIILIMITMIAMVMIVKWKNMIMTLIMVITMLTRQWLPKLLSLYIYNIYTWRVFRFLQSFCHIFCNL